jgi:hypothetical protein
MPARSDDAEIGAVLATEDRRRAALVELDLATLDHLFADDLVHIHGPGSGPGDATKGGSA